MILVILAYTFVAILWFSFYGKLKVIFADDESKLTGEEHLAAAMLCTIWPALLGLVVISVFAIAVVWIGSIAIRKAKGIE